ncbi:MAG: RDD family protein [Chromatiaceae bacterium]|jgi:uncharacterized RDD family membrane protein YckC
MPNVLRRLSSTGLDVVQAKSPGLVRRLAAIIYDLFLLSGVLVVAAAIVVVPYLQIAGPPFPHGSWWFRLYLLLVICGYFVFPWVRGGQTLGMRAWRFRLLREDGTDLRLRDAVARLLCAAVALAPAGAGLLWILLDRQGLAWHDRLSDTRPVMLKRGS